MVRAGIMFMFLLSAVAWDAPVYCEDEVTGHKILILKGNVSSVDWVKSMIVVKWFDRSDFRFDEVALYTERNTKITKKGSSIGLGDLNTGDRVIVEFYNDSPNPLKAVSITVS